MNRREFIKATGIALAALSCGTLPIAAAVPTCYRGFDIRIDKRLYHRLGDIKQIYAGNSKYHNSALFKGDKSDAEIWKSFKPALDGAIERLKKEVA